METYFNTKTFLGVLLVVLVFFFGGISLAKSVSSTGVDLCTEREKLTRMVTETFGENQ